ncbi:acyl-CoA carboxylase subunit epsilon [Serinicoccus sediminis]|uniref:acyl-CoA carboxylase subunit epsilon n=1 Tax=Serinicoccus sediminis TaxID=2306021 RepID=UPI0010228518|nr:acyl-CoA carboxylase subunit epsilon [Serinicoccus sediminis]
MSTADTDQPQPPVLRVVRGRPTPAQLAALTVVLTAAGDGERSEGADPRRTLWTARARYARPRPSVGPGGWRASALPR